MVSQATVCVSSGDRLEPLLVQRNHHVVDLADDRDTARVREERSLEGREVPKSDRRTPRLHASLR